MSIKSAQTKPIGDLLKDYMEHTGFQKKLDEMKAAECWNSVVGEKVAEMTEKVSCRNGILYVRCRSRVLRSELLFNSDGIKNALNRAIGNEVVCKIVIM